MICLVIQLFTPLEPPYLSFPKEGYIVLSLTLRKDLSFISVITISWKVVLRETKLIKSGEGVSSLWFRVSFCKNKCHAWRFSQLTQCETQLLITYTFKYWTVPGYCSPVCYFNYFELLIKFNSSFERLPTFSNCAVFVLITETLISYLFQNIENLLLHEVSTKIYLFV